jgi:hypothetical protein
MTMTIVYYTKLILMSKNNQLSILEVLSKDVFLTMLKSDVCMFDFCRSAINIKDPNLTVFEQCSPARKMQSLVLHFYNRVIRAGAHNSV